MPELSRARHVRPEGIDFASVLFLRRVRGSLGVELGPPVADVTACTLPRSNDWAMRLPAARTINRLSLREQDLALGLQAVDELDRSPAALEIDQFERGKQVRALRAAECSPNVARAGPPRPWRDLARRFRPRGGSRKSHRRNRRSFPGRPTLHGRGLPAAVGSTAVIDSLPKFMTSAVGRMYKPPCCRKKPPSPSAMPNSITAGASMPVPGAPICSRPSIRRSATGFCGTMTRPIREPACISRAASGTRRRSSP